MNRTEFLWARCEPELKDSVLALARQTRRDVSKTVRDAVQEYLARHGRWPAEQKQERKEAA